MVRVGGSIAVTGKMLRCGRNTGALQSPNHRGCKPRDQLRIRTKRSCANHGICGINVDIADRGKIYIDSGRSLSIVL